MKSGRMTDPKPFGQLRRGFRVLGFTPLRKRLRETLFVAFNPLDGYEKGSRQLRKGFRVPTLSYPLDSYEKGLGFPPLKPFS